MINTSGFDQFKYNLQESNPAWEIENVFIHSEISVALLHCKLPKQHIEYKVVDFNSHVGIILTGWQGFSSRLSAEKAFIKRVIDLI